MQKQDRFGKHIQIQLIQELRIRTRVLLYGWPVDRTNSKKKIVSLHFSILPTKNYLGRTRVRVVFVGRSDVQTNPAGRARGGGVCPAPN